MFRNVNSSGSMEKYTPLASAAYAIVAACGIPVNDAVPTVMMWCTPR
jgi:hypothetical protein